MRLERQRSHCGNPNKSLEFRLAAMLIFPTQAHLNQQRRKAIACVEAVMIKSQVCIAMQSAIAITTFRNGKCALTTKILEG